MDNQNGAAQLRYLEEIGTRLHRMGFETMPMEDQHLPVKWNDNYLCRISGRGSVLYREADVKCANAQDALHSVIDTAKMTSEYMAILEYAPQLKASGLVGDYRILGKDEVGSSNLPSSSKKHRKLRFSVLFRCKNAENGVGQNVGQALTHTMTHTRKCADRFKEHRRGGFAFSPVILCSFPAYMT